MAVKKWKEIRAKGLTKEQLAEVDRAVAQGVLEIPEAELRKLAGVTQEALAERAGVTQDEISRFERRDERLLSTLRKYIEAMGGELEIVARLGDTAIRLRV
jgi:DNA-binding XRE family transcriptional regulator